MPRLTAKQQALLRKLKQASRLHWWWIGMDSFIEWEAFQGRFQQYTSSQAHLDPDKAKEDKFGRRLLYLRDAFGKAAIAEGQELQRIVQQCEAAGIPGEVIFKHLKEPPKPPIRPTMEKLSAYLDLGKPLSHAKKELRDAIRNADSKTSQREINILTRYLAALRKIPEPLYEPPKRVKDYARMRRRPMA